MLHFTVSNISKMKGRKTKKGKGKELTGSVAHCA
jgi:hypothetical protein